MHMKHGINSRDLLVQMVGLIFSALFIVFLLLSSNHLFSQIDSFKTIYLDKAFEQSTEKDFKAKITIDQRGLRLSTGEQIFPVKITAKKRKSFIEAFSLKPDTLAPFFKASIYKKEGKPILKELFNFPYYIDTLPEFNLYYQKILPYLDSVFMPFDSSFNLSISLKSNGNIEYIEVYSSESSCLSTRWEKGLFGQDFYVYDTKDGMLHGRYFHYDKSGKLLLKSYYKDDQKQGQWIYFSNYGLIRSRKGFVNNERQGKTVFYNDEGKISSSTTYKNGKKHGPYSAYYENGQIKVLGNYFENKKSDVWLYFDKEGQLQKKRAYSLKSSQQKSGEK